MTWKAIFLALAISLCAAEDRCSPPPCRAVLAPARPCSNNSCGPVVEVSASFLLWQAKMWGLEFAAKSFAATTPGAAVQTLNQKLFVPDFAWETGMKANLDYRLPYDGWDLFAGWTYYHNRFTDLKKDFDSQVAPAGFGVIPLWQYPFVQISGDNTGNPLRYQSVSANWKVFFNSIDVELGRSFFPIQSLPMRFKIGAKGGWIRQSYNVAYENGTTILATSPSSFSPALFQFLSSRFAFSSQQWGLGPRIGLESKWNVWRGFNLVANGAFSILCSFFDLHSTYDDVIVQPTATPPSSRSQMDDDFRELTPVCEAMLGLDWGMCFCNNFYVGVIVGYEWQYWWSVNHVRRNYVQTLPGETFDMRGDLQMQGLNGAVKLDF